MVRGKSGRIVLEIDPSLKSDLYDALQEEGLTLKEWFLRYTGSYLAQRAQPSLFNSGHVAEVNVKSGKKGK
jgi:hypothetical protein